MTMKINAEFSESVAVHMGDIDWTPSPMAGVERRMLDRVGGEIARATSIVRYAPGSHFSDHIHSGGEEFIVLEGTFQDEHADYPAGSYVRNPIETHHVPRSNAGCTIFVKLWQFDPADQRQCALDLAAVHPAPLAGHDGIAQALLHAAANENVWLEHWHAGATRRIEDHGGAELLILEGYVNWRGKAYSRHDWIRIAPGAAAEFSSGADGARVWLKTDHLREIARAGWQSPAGN